MNAFAGQMHITEFSCDKHFKLDWFVCTIRSGAIIKHCKLVNFVLVLMHYPILFALALPLNRELKMLDSKELLLEVQLEESRAYFNLMNLSKSRAALTSARTVANSMYISPSVQVFCFEI